MMTLIILTLSILTLELSVKPGQRGKILVSMWQMLVRTLLVVVQVLRFEEQGLELNYTGIEMLEVGELE